MLALFKPNHSLTKVVTQLLQYLKVKVTFNTVKTTLENHPDYPSILSISDSLKQWKVDNCVIQADKEKLHELPVPFIAYMLANRSFITVTNITDSYVTFHSEAGGSSKKSIQEFLKEWSGVTLFAEVGEHSGEKNYEQSRRKEILQSLRLPFVIGVVLAFAAYAAIYQYNHTTIFIGYSLLLLLKLTGCAVSALLLWYEVDNANPVLKQICGMGGMGKQTNCSAVLNSKQAKLFNVISWSEIGFFYFAGGVISLLTAGTQLTNLLPVLAWLNVFALPYTLFSVYYQWKVAKQWCVLCLGVQALLVAEFITSFAFNTFSTSSFIIHNSTFIILLPAFLLPLISWHLLKPILLQNQEAKRKRRELLKFKYDQRIFDTLLLKQKQITEPPDNLGITIGNTEATNTIIKVCNPYCGPCAKAHPAIDELLENNNDLKAQILFTATNNENDRGSKPVKHLLAVADNRNEQITKQALDDWYLTDKKDYKVFASKYPMNGELKMQDAKVEAMDKWCKQTEIAFTPTFFVNGYQLPDVYNIGDLKYFLHPSS